ncbi:uncharacterized protein PFL1_01671 [Pseudozyma flocculosa PF-1]|uniref:Zn(2)-C6 fungal-type domain-containing protein n=1 Tax=Pseudozyma flocculosa TaxID=84751 RepID=A0A5C3EZM4_9BASI|nr:uncharacterized protein PFL1_01671 [Pseudozyma flocculosa PF-1]EPQ30770.1 hypothetical protein PFL1_01671 [Pseudozyma flocculosa PF-1]SPO36867.1 uncharacterized protein PSFLO_02338 [Pseudozyma flocculosa]
MDRASFYTNASGPNDSRSSRHLGPSLEELAPRGYSSQPPAVPHGAPRHRDVGDYPTKHSLPPILPREGDARMYESYARPLPRRPWDSMAQEGHMGHPSPGMVSPIGAHRLARTPSPPPPPPLHPSGRHMPPMALDRGHYQGPMHPQMYADRDMPPSRPMSFDEAHVPAPIKRPRVSLACLACRNRKSRCDGNRPTCKTCAHMKIECKWPEIDFRRAKTGDAARLRRKDAGAAAQERSSPQGAHATNGHSGDHGRRLSPPRSGDAPRTMARLPSPTAVRSIGSALQLPRTTYHPYPPFGRSPGVSTFERTDYADGGRHHPGERRLGSPSERYLVAQAPDVDLRGSRHHPGHDEGERAFASSLASSSSDGMAVDLQNGERTPPKASSASSHPQTRRDYPARSVSPNRLEASQTRDIAAKLLALTRVDLGSHRHGLPKAEVALGTSSATSRRPLRHEAERLDDVFAVDWARLSVPRTAFTREFTDAMAGSTAYLQIVDDDNGREGETPRPPSRAVLHMFQTSISNASGHAKVQRMSVLVRLPEQAVEDLLRKPTNHPLPLRDLDLDLSGCVATAAASDKSSGDSNLALLAGEAALDRGPRFGQGGSEKVPEVARELSEGLFDDDVPKSGILGELLRDISGHLAGIYLFFDKADFEARVRQDDVSAVLLNAVCGLGARFCDHRFVEGFSPADYAEAFSRKAHQLFWQAVTFPTCDAVSAGVLLAICEIGANRASSASTIIAAASRMALELGLHRVPPPGSSLTEEQRQTDEFLFWSIYALDRIASVMTGRPFALQDRDIDARLPTLSSTSRATSFAYLIDLIRVSNNKLSETLFSPMVVRSAQEAEQIQVNLLASIEADTRHWFNSLPGWLRFSPGNLRRASERGESVMFCGVHFTYHCTFLWRYLLDTSITMRSQDLARLRQAAYGIAEISDLCLESNDVALESLPMMSPAFFLAACVLVAELEQLGELDKGFFVRSSAPGGRDDPRAPSSFSPARDEHDAAAMARSALQTCLRALEKRKPYWADARSAEEILLTYLAARSSRKMSTEAVTDLLEQLRYLVVLRDDVLEDLGEDIRDLEAGPVVEEVKDARHLAPFFPALFH